MSSAAPVALLLATMLAWLPPSRVSTGPWAELAGETAEQTTARYLELAVAAVAVAERHPPLFAEASPATARLRTAALLLSLAFHESGFHNRVTTMRGDDRARSDAGRSWCAVQIMLGRSGVSSRRGGHLARLIPEGWSGRQLEEDPAKCLLVGYRFARASLERCGTLGLYTGEGCRGGPKARARLSRAQRLELR